jgi:hypothetical protein
LQPDLVTYPFEIHLTVRKPESIEAFRAACVEMGVKPIILDLQDRTGTTVLEDVMTSSRISAATKDVPQHLYLLQHAMMAFGFDVVRTKVETVPWHPAASSLLDRPKMPENRYFESHIQVVVPDGRFQKLRSIAESMDAHLSRNVFKRAATGDPIMMLTLRDYQTTAGSFQDDVEATVSALRYFSFDVGKVEVEFAIFDSNVDHDAAWINA